MPQTLETCVCLCKQLGLPLHPEMLEGPATRLTILGIELDSETLQARLPAEKRDRIVTLLDEWSAKRFCRRRELESLIGHLHHACKVACKVAGWAGQSGVLVPWGCDCGCSPRVS